MATASRFLKTGGAVSRPGLQVEREEMKGTELTQAAPESQSFGHMESDGLDSEEAGGTHCEHGEPHTRAEAISQKTSASVCSSTTDGHGEPVEANKKRGRPRRRKPLASVDEKDPQSVCGDAVQHEEISTTLPLPTCVENHNNNSSSDVPNATGCSFVSPHAETSHPHTLPDVKLKDSVLSKRKRGRPKKTEITPPCSPAHASRSGPAQRLRSREEQPLIQDRTAESDSLGDLRPAEVTLTGGDDALSIQGYKQRRATLDSPSVSDHQVPAKVSRLDVSQEVPLAASSGTDQEKTVEPDKPVEVNADKQVTDKDEGMCDRLPAHSGDPPKQPTEQKEGVLLLEPHSQPATEPDVTPSEGLGRLHEERPTQSHDPKITAEKADAEEVQSKTSPETLRTANLQNPESRSTDAVTSSERPPQPDRVLPAVKTENIEVELDGVYGVSESNTSLQYDAKTAVKTEPLSDQQNTFRRKRGGKRRRRRINNFLPKPQPVEGHEGNAGVEEKKHCGDLVAVTDSMDNINVIYTKKGGKTLLKCGECGQTCKFLSQFIIHQRVHTGERPFKCPDCGKGFSKNSNLNLHLKTHQKRNNSYQRCPICGINFCCSEYASHMEIHQDQDFQKSEKQLKGEDDDEDAGGDDDDVKIIPTTPPPELPETNERKVCQYCGKTFRFPSALIRHVRVHTGEKPYKCDICGKAFGQAYFLRVHELTHWSVKRYNCTRCEKSFTHYSNAKNHTCRPPKSKNGFQAARHSRASLTFTCHICKDVSASLQDFNSHMRDHTGTKLYRCTCCDKLFGVLSEFTAHRSQCRGGRAAPSHAIKEEETASPIPYSVPSVRSRRRSAAKASPARRKKRPAGLEKAFQLAVVRTRPLSHFVTTLNKMDDCSDPRRYPCPSCGRLFRHMGRLRAHMLTHAPGQSYTCACCGKTLEGWKKLWLHQRLHRRRRGRFACPQCGRGFRFVAPYRKHMREHPEFQWVQARPKKALLPYQCEQCRCSFKSLDLLFSHQLCHSSAQDTHKDMDLDLSLDDDSTQSDTRMLSPLINSHVHPEHNDSPLSPTSTRPAPQDSTLAPKGSSVPNEGPSRTLHRHGNTHSSKDGENIFGRVDEKSSAVPSSSLSNEGSSNGVSCAVCGDAYSVISDLYHHYLQHARGELF